MNSLEKIIVLGIASAFSCIANAQQWELFRDEPWGAYSVDISEVNAEDHDGVTLLFARVKNQHKQPNDVGVAYTLSNIVVNATNCQNMVTVYHNYDAQGRFLRSRESSPLEQAIDYIAKNRNAHSTDKYSVDLCRKLLTLVAEGKVTKKVTPSAEGEIPLRKSGGVYEARILLNDDVATYFIIDSGASDLTVSEDVFKMMMRNGSLQASDIKETATYRIANGQSVRGTVFNMKKVTIGALTLTNVRAVVLPGADSPLLGQSFLRRLGSWKINSQRNVLEVAK